MSETDVQADLEAQIEAKLNSDDSVEDSEVNSDTTSDEAKVDSEVEEEETTSDTDSEDSEPEPDVEFNFKDSKVNIQNLVSKLKNLPEEERNERISKLTREKEIEAVKEAFPDAIKEETKVTREELDALNAKLEELTRLAKPEELQKALDIAAKLQATEGLTDSRMKDLMLQEQFGESYKDVSEDPKFKNAYNKFPTLPIEERLEYACSLSPIAKNLAMADEVKKQVRLQNTKTVSKGKQVIEKSELKAEDVKNLDDFDKLFESKFNG